MNLNANITSNFDSIFCCQVGVLENIKNIYYTLEISLQYYKEIYVYITKKICQIDEGTSKG